MAAPTRYHGKNATIYANGYAIQTYLRKLKISRKASNPEDTTIGATGSARTRVEDGIVDASIDYEGKFDDASGAIDSQLNTILNSAGIVWIMCPFGETAIGDIAYGMQGVENSYQSDADNNNIVTFSGGSDGTAGDGDVAERLTLLHILGAETATGVESSHDNGASTTAGGSAYLEVTTSDTLTSLDVIIQGSATNAWSGEETTIATFTQVTSTPASERVEIAGTIPRYLRAKHTLTGTSVTYIMGVHRYV